MNRDFSFKAILIALAVVLCIGVTVTFIFSDNSSKPGGKDPETTVTTKTTTTDKTTKTSDDPTTTTTTTSDEPTVTPPAKTINDSLVENRFVNVNMADNYFEFSADKTVKEFYNGRAYAGSWSINGTTLTIRDDSSGNSKDYVLKTEGINILSFSYLTNTFEAQAK